MDLTEKITKNILHDPDISKSLDLIIKIAAEEYIKKIYILEGQLKDKSFSFDELTHENLCQKKLIENQEEEVLALQNKVAEFLKENEELKEKFQKAGEGLLNKETDSEKLNYAYQKQSEQLSHALTKDRESERKIEELRQMLQRKDVELNDHREKYERVKEKVDRMESFANVKDRVAKQMQASFLLLNESIDKSKKSVREKDVEITRLQRIVQEQTKRGHDTYAN